MVDEPAGAVDVEVVGGDRVRASSANGSVPCARSRPSRSSSHSRTRRAPRASAIAATMPRTAPATITPGLAGVVCLGGGVRRWWSWGLRVLDVWSTRRIAIQAACSGGAAGVRAGRSPPRAGAAARRALRQLPRASRTARAYTPAATSATISTASAAASARTHGATRAGGRSRSRRSGTRRIVARRLLARGRDENVARPGGEEVRHVEPARAAHQRRHALLEQHSLQHLALGLVAGRGHPHERTARVLRADLAGALLRRGRRVHGRPRVDERRAAARQNRSGCACPVRASGAHERAIAYSTTSRRPARPSHRRSATPRTSGSSSLTPTITYSASG